MLNSKKLNEAKKILRPFINKQNNTLIGPQDIVFSIDCFGDVYMAYLIDIDYINEEQLELFECCLNDQSNEFFYYNRYTDRIDYLPREQAEQLYNEDVLEYKWWSNEFFNE